MTEGKTNFFFLLLWVKMPLQDLQMLKLLKIVNKNCPFLFNIQIIEYLWITLGMLQNS